MIKREMYPKTKRLSCSGVEVYVTEKMDGQNMLLFKKDGELHIAQRSTIFVLSEFTHLKGFLYKGLAGWLEVHGKLLEENLHEGSVVCGEWMGAGHIKYPQLKNRFYMYAKANLDENEEYSLTNIIYDRELFIYPFVSIEVPDFISVVPLVKKYNHIPTKEELDQLYEDYSGAVDRNVEGFVVNFENFIFKYVRMKEGKLSEHFDRNK